MMPITVPLRSNGGLFNDGYLLRETFREKGVTTVINDSRRLRQCVPYPLHV